MKTSDRPTTVVNGQDQTERSRAILSTYLKALVEGGDYAKYLAETVTFTLMDTGEVTAGREAVAGLIDYLHRQTFAATPVVKGLVVDGDRAMLEAEFKGRHVGEFAGLAATNREISVSYAVAYEVDDDLIRALRAYMPIDILIRQIREE